MTRRETVSTLAGFAAFAALVALGLALPHYLGEFEPSRLARAGALFIAILGLNILTGYTGQISLGHGAFMAIGGYTTAILVTDHGVQDLWTIPIAGLVAGAAGVLVGVPALRLTGLYVALATFGIAVALPQLLRKFSGLTGGTQGIQLFADPNYTGQGFLKVDVLGARLPFNDWLYYLTWTIAAVLFAIAWLLLRGRLGRTMAAIRDSEVAATAFGVNAPVYKTLAFGLSAFYAGIAGSLFALVTGFVNPETFPIVLSLFLVIGAVVAGLGSLWGILAGALFIQYLPELAVRVSKSEGVPTLVYGVALIVVVVLLPSGAAGLLRRLGEPLTARLPGRS